MAIKTTDVTLETGRFLISYARAKRIKVEYLWGSSGGVPIGFVMESRFILYVQTTESTSSVDNLYGFTPVNLTQFTKKLMGLE